MKLPDVHLRIPEITIPLNKVGVASVKMPIGYLWFENVQVMMLPVFEAYIDLPINLKGINASRNYEVIIEVLRSETRGTSKLEKVCVSIAKELLKKHSYATRYEARAYGELLFKRTTPKTRIRTYEPSDIMASAIAMRMDDGSIDVKKSIGVGVLGLTACPCAQEVLKEISKRELKRGSKIDDELIERLFQKMPLATHMQRAYGSIHVEIPESCDIDAQDLVKIIEDSMSSSTYGLLKRVDEVEVIKTALYRPRFAEDVIRYMIVNFVNRFPELPNETQVTFYLKSLESIHKHDFVAEVIDNLGHLREILNANKKGVDYEGRD
ncbi:MAG: GTP cyclohydrolase MptA [Nitrososphaerales archaeon]|nr:GTP cyclohydrolase MptA [Nitrososphaerales archaeon]